jgi:NAD(P)-dependent dehydrogenase (short-subunit alcohol dehydrogenase family)
VIAAGRGRERLEDLAARTADPRLAIETVDALDPDLAERAKEMAYRHGSLDGVVVSVASWGDQGRRPALSLTDQEWDHLLAANLTAVFRLYREFFPHIAPGGALVQLNGMSADIPFPGAAGVAVSAAARKSLTRTIAAEVNGDRLNGGGPRGYGVILGMVRTRPRQLAGIDDPGWIPASDVGWHVAELVAGASPLIDEDLHYFVDVATGPRRETPR